MKDIWRNLKRLYNRWLFEKYGHVKGDYENIPVIYMLCPLWSPSLYWLESMDKIKSEALRGFEEGLKKGAKKRETQLKTMDLAEQIAVSLGIEEDDYENQNYRDIH